MINNGDIIVNIYEGYSCWRSWNIWSPTKPTNMSRPNLIKAVDFKG